MAILKGIVKKVRSIFGVSGAFLPPNINNQIISEHISIAMDDDTTDCTKLDNSHKESNQNIDAENNIITVKSNKIAVTTRSYNNYRDGTNLHETVLTSEAIQQNGIKHLFDCVLQGDDHGCGGMPLLVPDLLMEDDELHNVLFVCTMNNNVYAFDANHADTETDKGKILWQKNLGKPANITTDIDGKFLNHHCGILSTPVIDLKTKTLYCVSLISDTGQIADGQYFLQAIDLVKGDYKAPPLNVSKVVYQPPHGLSEIKHDMSSRKQQSSLLFDSRNGVDTVFFPDSNLTMISGTDHGFVIACDVTDVEKGQTEIAACWSVTSRFADAGISMAGGGLLIDDYGYLYAFTANGAFDGETDFGNSCIKLKFTPKTATSSASLNIVDWWSPFTTSGRSGKNPTSPWIAVNEDSAEIKDNKNKAVSDQDLASPSPVYLSKTATGFTDNVILSVGKDGILYVMNADNLGKTALEDFSPDNILHNYSKLLVEPLGFTYYPAGVNLMPSDLSLLDPTYYGVSHGQYSTPCVYKSPDHGFLLFGGGENGPARVFQIAQDSNGKYSVNFIGEGTDYASAPGSFITITANGAGTNTGVLWCLQPIGDAQQEVVSGRLICYGANWFNGSTIIKIWDSQDWNIQFKYSKFNIPMVANGKAYIPTYDGRIMVFGLA